MPVQLSYSSGVTTQFTYGGTGERVKKRVNSGGNVTDTYYIGDHFEVRGGETIKYIFAGNLRVAQVKGSTRSFFHKDHLGSSTVMTDASGYVIESTEYMPFGSVRSHSGASTSDYKYTDQELDAENGLYNYNARLYDPFIGRFITPDTIVPEPFNPQSLNRYSYCLNNPLIYVDPSGHAQKKKGDDEEDEETLDTIYVWGVKVPDPFTLWNDICGEIPPWIEAQQIKLQMEFEAMIASLYGGDASKNVVRKKIPKNVVRMKIPKPIGVDSGGVGGAFDERAYDKAVRLFDDQGIPYLPGGVTKKGMDCSGFINATLYGEGVTNPRITTNTWPGNVSGWYKIGEGLNVAKAKDILVWTTASGDKTNHIAFYAGENTLFHACNKYGVAHTNNIKEYWIYQGKPDVYREVGY